MAIDTSIFSGIIFNILYVFFWAGVLGAGGAIAYVIYKRRKYNFTCVVYLKRGNEESEIKLDKGGFFKLKGGSYVFRFLKSKHTIKPPANKFICKRSRGLPLIHFRCFGADLYEPFIPRFDEKAEDKFLMDLDYDETLSWNISTKELVKRTLDWGTVWEKYKEMISLAIIIVAVLVAIFLVLKFAQATVGDLVGAIRETSNVFVKWAEQQASTSQGGVAP